MSRSGLHRGRPVIDYVVQLATAGGAWTTVDDGMTAERSAIVEELRPGSNYRFRVAAVNSYGVGVASTPVAVTIPPTPPTAPLDLTAVTRVGNGPPLIELSWSEPVSDGGAPITDYAIQRSPNGTSRWVTIDDGVGTDTSYVARMDASGAGIFFRVVADNVAGPGPASDVVGARSPSAAPTAPSVAARPATASIR